MTLDDAIRGGLDVTALPPGTVLILRCRNHLHGAELARLVDEARRLAAELDIRLAIVSPDFDVIPVPATAEAPQ